MREEHLFCQAPCPPLRAAGRLLNRLVTARGTRGCVSASLYPDSSRSNLRPVRKTKRLFANLSPPAYHTLWTTSKLEPGFQGPACSLRLPVPIPVSDAYVPCQTHPADQPWRFIPLRYPSLFSLPRARHGRPALETRRHVCLSVHLWGSLSRLNSTTPALWNFLKGC